MGYFFMVIGICFTLIFLARRKAQVDLNTVIFKGVSSLGFIFSAIFFFVGNESCPDYLGAFTIAGACFGLIGDITLDFKYLYSQDSRKYSYLGFCSFLVGHVFYCIAMVSVYGIELLNIICVVAGIIAGIVVALLTEKIMKLNYGEFKKISVLYTAFLCMALGFSGGYTLTENFSLHTVLLNIGFVLFVISDAFLAGIYFSTKEKDRTNRVTIVLNHAFYYAAQYIIVLSLAFYRG